MNIGRIRSPSTSFAIIAFSKGLLFVELISQIHNKNSKLYNLGSLSSGSLKSQTSAGMLVLKCMTPQGGPLTAEATL